ncbi:MAG: hypothetical protein COA78_07125 [Blastopirellula sp.]|nr:MAG: hypothetical protein COA78_07125 [Blastopirellula sp.]
MDIKDAKFVTGETFKGEENDDNGGTIAAAGINVGNWGNRIEVKIYGSAEFFAKDHMDKAAADAEALRDYVLEAITFYQGHLK